MKIAITFLTLLITYVTPSIAQNANFNPEVFANTYFSAWNKTQMPEASEEDLENFLALLTEDVALQHLPYDTTDEREPNGKEVIRTGMSRWRGANTSYTAKLIEINHGHNVIILKYQAIMTIQDEKTRKERTITRNNIEVLELDKGKVSVIRKYGKY
jgi:ketosteroid isomerase-like protein